MNAIRLAVITCSDTLRESGAEDSAGRAVMGAAEARGWDVVAYHVALRDVECITASLMDMADVEEAEIVMTVGATGVERRDVAPEATLDVIEREVPGIAEAVRAGRTGADAFLSRGIAGEREGTLIVNLPGSQPSAVEAFEIAAPLLERAVELMRGQS